MSTRPTTPGRRPLSTAASASMRFTSSSGSQDLPSLFSPIRSSSNHHDRNLLRSEGAADPAPDAFALELGAQGQVEEFERWARALDLTKAKTEFDVDDVRTFGL
jgi:hypothetical protein